MVRKRTIISIIITIAAIIGTNKFWLHFSPVPVDMDIKGKGTALIEVQLNKKDDDKFRKIKTGRADINLDSVSHATIFVNRARHPKRIKIIFSNLDENDLKISNITLRKGKQKLDITKFKVENGTSKIKDNNLVLNTKNCSVTITYPEHLKIRAVCKFDFLLLVIITVLTYLFAFKISDYIADFKTFKGKSRVDIIFLTIFFIMLCIPASHINQEENLWNENRAAAKWHPLFTHDYGINYNFGNDFNNWFNDRFNFRQNLFDFYINDIKYYSNPDYIEVPLGYLYKKSGWMFYNQNQGDTNNTFTPLTSEELELYTDNIKKLKIYCNKNNIKLYIVILPTKEWLYQENDYVHNDVLFEKTKALVDKVKTNVNFEIIYPVNELLNLKKHEYVCFKTDHHLTDSAQYEIYKILMKKILKDFPDSFITPQTDFNISYSNLTRWDADREYRKGCNYERSGLNKKSLFKTKYKYFDYKYPEKILVEGEFPYYHHFNKSGRYKIFIIGNSFMDNLTYFLNTSFKEILKYRFNSPLDVPQRLTPLDMNGYFPLIEKQKPDILLIVLSSGYIDSFGGMYPQGDN